MNETTPPESIEVSMVAMSGLAVECWRIAKSLSASANTPAGARHGLRRIEDFLKQNGFEILAMDGRAFDPGLPLKVIDCMDDPALPKGQTVVSETISPMIVYRGQVIRYAEVITRRGPA